MSLSGAPGIVEKARGEARGAPRMEEFVTQMEISLLSKKVALCKTKGVKELDRQKDCGKVPQGVRA